MKAILESELFPRELAGWSLRGAGCAASSVALAVRMGFTAPAELAGMLAGLAVWVVLFAAFCVWHLQAPNSAPGKLVPALKIAAWLKCLLSATGWGITALEMLGKKEFGFIFLLPDCLPGIVAAGGVSLLSGSDDPSRLDSFGWTVLTTLADGALSALIIGGLALAVVVWWIVVEGLRRPETSPTRHAG